MQKRKAKIFSEIIIVIERKRRSRIRSQEESGGKRRGRGDKEVGKKINSPWLTYLLLSNS